MSTSTMSRSCRASSSSCSMFLTLVLLVLGTQSRSSACPMQCACPVPSEVHCTFRYLSTMPRELDPAVKRINMGYNSLTMLRENDLSGLENLELLMLHSNTIQTIEDRSFHDMKTLQVLKMSYNRVKELRKETFQGLDNILRLYVDHNRIEFIHPEAFYGLTSLQFVNLEGNSLQQLHPDTFITLRHSQIFKISSIKTIYLSDNALTGLPATLFTGCYQLENVFLNGNPWSCDCRMDWLAAWIEKNPGILKCKRDKKLPGEHMCPICESPHTSKGSSMIHLSSHAYACSKPWIHPDLKQKNITMDESSYTSVFPKDFIAPIGTMEMNITDEFHKDASISCVVQRPSDLSGLNLTYGVNGEDVTTLSATVVISLICNIDRDHIRPLWSILASYSDSPMRLERGSLLTGPPEMIYKYSQAMVADDEIFTEIEADIKANPAWLMQDVINFQLDRTTTTHTTLHIKYLSNIKMNIETNKVKRGRYGWTMINRDNQTKTEFSVLSGGLVELNCQTDGDPRPSIEWILPDGSKVRAPYSSEDQRIVISDDGKLTLKAVYSSDDGVYHCIATNYLDADVLSIRVAVMPPDAEESEVNGVQVSRSLGGSLFLHCESSGSPPASVHWILPDHTVLDQSFGNRNLYPNGTLKILQLTDRDRGIYRCLAANHLGVDLLASQVMVLGNKPKTDVQESEGSGDDSQTDTDDTQVFDSETISARVNQESRTITSDRPYPRLRPSLPRGSANRRGGSRRMWNRRVFDKSSRKVDPQILADYIKKSQKFKSNQDENELKADRGHSDGEEGSGSVVFEDETSIQKQVTPITENPENLYKGVMITGHRLEDNQINATPITRVSDDIIDATGTENMVSTASYTMPDAYPVEPSVTVRNGAFQNDDTTPFITTQGYSDTQMDGTTYSSKPSTSKPLQPVTLKFTVTDTVDEMELPFSGDMPDTKTETEVLPYLDSEIPNMTPAMEIPVQSVKPGVYTSTDPKSQTTFTAVTTTEREQDEIMFHTTQRIKSHRLPPGSTIISHNQIHIIPPNDKRPGRRRNFPNRRRIIRPNKITDIQSLLDKLKRPAVKYGRNATVTYTVELTTGHERVSTVKPMTTQNQNTVSPTGIFYDPTSASRTEKTTTTQSAPFVTLPNSFKGEGEAPKQKPTQDTRKTISTTGMPSATTIKSSKVIQGKIPWDRLFGSKGSRREILKRLRKPAKPQTTTQTTISIASTTTTAPSMVITALPTAESLAAPMTATPPVTQRNPDEFEISSDDFSGSSTAQESQTTEDVVALFTTASPSKSYVKTTAMYKPASTATARVSRVSSLPALTTTKTTSKEETIESSGLDSGGFSGRFRGNQKPGFNRRRFRGRRPSKTSTTQAPTITSAPFKLTSSAPQIKVSKDSYTPTGEVVKSSVTTSSDITDADNDERASQTKVLDSPGTYSTTQELSPTSSPSYKTTNTPRPYTTPRSEILSNQITTSTNTVLKRPPETGGRPNTSSNLPDQSNTKASTVKDRNERTQSPDHTTVYDTTTSNTVDFKVSTENTGSKPRIVGGNAASFTVQSNSDAFLPCEATGDPKPSISWKRTNTGSTLTIKGKVGKFEMFSNGTLLIQNTNVRDRGQYVCLAENVHGSDKLHVMLTVVAYPARILEPKMRDIKVHSGQRAEMRCKTLGTPTPVLSWILANRTQVRSQNNEHARVTVTPEGTLIIRHVSVYDRGQYKCIVSNSAGADTASVRLQVVAAPPVILEEKRQLVRADVGQSVWMPCTARGDPQPTTQWVLMDGTAAKSIHADSRISSLPNGTLYMKNLDVSDSGMYECIATSSTGSERRVVTLSVEKTETAPYITETSNLRTELEYGGQLQLNCSATGNPRPRIMWRLPSKALVDQWHRMGSRIQVLENGTLVIDSVSDKDAGDYLCVARSKAGDDLQLMKVSVSMKPAKIEPKIVGKKQIPYGKDLKVDCKASGAPIPEISWGLPDGTLVNSALQADSSNAGIRSKRYILFDNGTLYLNEVGMDEEGDYTCYAENTLGKDEMHVHITVVTAAPRIRTPSLTYAKVKPGGIVRFDCEAVGEPKPKIIWILPSGDMIAASNERYLMHVNGSLDIRNIKFTDAGEYVCTARNTAGDDSKVYKLQTDGNPPIINGYYKNRTIIKETAEKYTRKLIDCSARGDPPPKITWIMPDNIFLSAPYYGSRINVHYNGTLEIRHVRPTDTAEFICMAQNDGGEAVMVVQLEVTNQLMRPIFKNPFNNRLVTRLGKTTVLNCSADGNPQPDMIWTLPNGTQFTGGPHLGSRFQLGTDGTFVIYNPSKEDAGRYRCAAKNKVGYIEKLIVLEVGQKPYILTRPKGIIRGMSGEPLFLHCLVDGSPRPNILWTVPGGHVISHPQIISHYQLMDNGTLVIHQTKPHDRGNYLCRAKNYVGEAVLNVPVMIIAYPPRITYGPPPALQTMMGTPVQLNCVATGVPKPEITWELPDRSVLSTAKMGRPSGSELLHPQGTLIIQKLSRADSGLYKCLATNHLGTDSRATYMRVI
ncbi:immunoglobulin superfamily member 10 [Trichomycterus rosablanca]|uniref:immunoglobulin superfamily member 10 n=1 Tax=Trichomycterus rosablanca TaxID=2290929 RepID=UPI002F3584E6